jgi:hypothetical protein
VDKITLAVALEALRHYVQDHGDEDTVLGDARERGIVEWIAGLVRTTFPPSYLQFLEKHDGLSYPLFRLLESFETYALYRDRWGVPRHYWPIAGDGCGNYYVLATALKDSAGEAPVAFIEPSTSAVDPNYWAASSYAHFVFFMATRLCAEKGCSKFLRYPRSNAWPFDADFVLSVDPDLARLQPRNRWPT